MNFRTLYKKYLKYTPSYTYIINNYFNKGYKIDHIAHRSFDKGFLITEYIKRNYSLQPENYSFKNLNVDANWVKDSNKNRVFISQYNGSLLYEKLNTYEKYLDTHNYNQYLSWLQIFGHDINHIAIQTTNIMALYERLFFDKNIKLATNIEKSRDGKLLQFSLVADPIKIDFGGEEKMVPGYFVEFIEREKEGFDTNNATQIFSSTKIA
jgi:hypothetical protein